MEILHHLNIEKQASHYLWLWGRGEPWLRGEVLFKGSRLTNELNILQANMEDSDPKVLFEQTRLASIRQPLPFFDDYDVEDLFMI